MAGSLPTGTVTFLFTDIEGSTKLARAHPDQWESLRERHNQILRRAIESNHGFVFQVVGDSFCSAFHTPSDGIRAALKAQTDLHGKDWGETPIRVRMGVHTGEAVEESGEYRGYAALSTVQRVMSAAHGGQVLLSHAAFDLAENDLPRGVTARDLGPHRLKDARGPEHLYQIVAAGLPSEFPSLRTLEAHAHNLPIQLTSFIGRETELAELRRIIRRSRLVTLTGVGGTGKTRLALEVAAPAVDEFRDGVWIVELAPISDAGLVSQVIAESLSVHEQTGRTFLDVLKDHLSSRNALLLLDNCEHLIDECAQVADALLHAAPELKILATSREALGIAGEAAFPVRSLSLPAPTAESPEAISDCDAVRLFEERARATQPAFELTDVNAGSVAKICARLDGIPLALELAAARVKGLGVDQIASRLDDRFRLLTGGSRTALPRQRTLQAAIDWSYRLLSQEERLVLQRLSAFSGGWIMEAAEAVCSGDNLESGRILDLQLRLVDKSLILAETEGLEPRYHMLETIRQYAQEKLDESGEAEQARRRHLAYFLEWAEEAEPQFKGPDAIPWLDRLDKERDNLRAAFEFGIHSGHPELAVRLVNAAFWLWWSRGPWSEGQRWAEAALGKAREDQPAAKAKLLMVLGCFLFTQSDYARARDVYEKSLAIWRKLEDKFWNAFTLVMLSFVVRVENPSAATDLVLEGLRLGREGNDPWVVATCLCFGGEAALNRGDLAAAREMLAESAALFRTVGDRWVKNEMLRAMGELAEVEGDYPRAVDLYKESLAASHEIGDTTSPGEVNGNLARVMLLTGNFDEARRLCEQILREALQQGKKINVLGALAGFGVIAQARGDAGRAVRLLQASESLFDGLRASLYVNPRESSLYNEQLAAARAQLGEDDFAAARNESRAMTLEQAVRYALGDVQEA